MTASGAATVVCVIDPVSTGAALARYLADRGHLVVRLFSDMCPATVRAHVKAGFEVDWLETIQHESGGLKATAARIKELKCMEVFVGCESGVNLYDELTAALGVRGNPSPNVAARRNKFLQAELVRSAGLDAPRQQLAVTLDDVETFLATFGDGDGVEPFKAVCKPVEGAGSDGVSICNAPDEVRTAFLGFEGTKNVLGLDNYEVLLQEFLHGTEYVVDTVSRDGEHKCVAIWRYDKRDYHGSPVVYHGMRLLNVEANPALHGAMVAYIKKVLDALEIRNGAMHSEVMATPRGPVLVEVNCRLHGGEGIWLPIAARCLGYTQVGVLYDAHFDKDAFGAIPPTPQHPMLAHGAWVTVRSPASGTISEMNHAALETIRALPSYFDEYLAPFVVVGGQIVQTVDACTVHGCFNLAHPDKDQLEADYQTAQRLVNEGLFCVLTLSTPCSRHWSTKTSPKLQAVPLQRSSDSVMSDVSLDGLGANGEATSLGVSLFGGILPPNGRSSPGRTSSPSELLPGPARRISREIFGAEHQEASRSTSPTPDGSTSPLVATSPVLRHASSPVLMGIGPVDATGMQSLTLDATGGAAPSAAAAPKINVAVKIS